MTYRFDPELVPWLAAMPAEDLSEPARARPRAGGAARLPLTSRPSRWPLLIGWYRA